MNLSVLKKLNMSSQVPKTTKISKNRQHVYMCMMYIYAYVMYICFTIQYTWKSIKENIHTETKSILIRGKRTNIEYI